jgi:hypothetical protein
MSVYHIAAFTIAFMLGRWSEKIDRRRKWRAGLTRGHDITSGHR